MAPKTAGTQLWQAGPYPRSFRSDCGYWRAWISPQHSGPMVQATGDARTQSHSFGELLRGWPAFGDNLPSHFLGCPLAFSQNIRTFSRFFSLVLGKLFGSWTQNNSAVILTWSWQWAGAPPSFCPSSCTQSHLLHPGSRGTVALSLSCSLDPPIHNHRCRDPTDWRALPFPPSW